MELNTSLESRNSSETTSDDILSKFAGEISNLNDQEQRIFKNRLRRRRQHETSIKIKFDCQEHELRDESTKRFADLLDNSELSIHCFKVILNSLHAFYRQYSTCSKECDESVAKFLRGVYLEDLGKMLIPSISTKNGKAELAFRQRELMSLLSLHLFRYYPQPIEKLNVGPFLRFIYFHAGADRLRIFMDTTFCDEFFIDLPFYVAAIYDEIGLNCPIDIGHFLPHEEEGFVHQEELKNLDNLATRLESFINSVKVDNVEDEEEGKKQIEQAKNKTTPKSRKKATKILRAPNKIFPESPEKRCSRINSTFEENSLTLVENTPISKKFNRLPMETMSKLAKKWLFIDDNEETSVTNSKVISNNRKRAHDKLLSQNLVSTKIQKGEKESKSSYYNLSILFSNFQ